MSLTASDHSVASADFSASVAGHIQAWVYSEVDSQSATQTVIRYIFGFNQTQTYSDSQDYDAWINGTNVNSQTLTNNKDSGHWQFYETTKTYTRPAYGSATVFQNARCQVDNIFDGPTSNTGTHNITTGVPAQAGTVLGGPTGLTATGVTSSGMTIGWTAPASAGIGPAATNYYLQVSTDPAFGTAVFAAWVGNVSSYAVTGLARATTYYARVLAGNSVGNGAYSSNVGATTLATAPDVMDAPTVNAPTSAGFSVAFTPPNNGGSAITSYKVEVSTDSFSTIAATFTGIASSPTVLTGLAPGVKYKARIAAINAIGQGTMSAASLEIQTLGGVKIWNGTGYTEAIVRCWNGTAWIVVVVRKWNGSAWVV